MALLWRNVLANLLSGVWIAVLTLVVTPIQVGLLGVEAYAVIGFITTLQVMLGVFDLGLASTLTREIARDQSLNHSSSTPLIRTALSIYWLMALALAATLMVAAKSIAHAWFRETHADPLVLEYAMQVVALFLALRWPVAMYSGVLAGAQRMDVLNLAKGVLTSVRLIGGVVIIVIYRDLPSFLHWTVFSALVEVAVYALLCRRMLPWVSWRPGFSTAALRKVWAFSLNMNGLAVVTVILTQVDRLFISRMLPLEELGYYVLAYQAATSISVLLTALSTALMPSLAEAHGAQAHAVLLSRYHIATQALLFSSGTVLFMLLFFGEPLLSLWVNPAAAARSWVPLAFLAAGFWLSAACAGAYTAAVACGRAKLMLKISAASAVPYLAALYTLIDHWGIAGAAAAWTLLNLGYVIFLIPAAHRQVLGIPFARWVRDAMLPFALLGFLSFGLARVIALGAGLGYQAALALLVPATALYIWLGFVFAGDAMRAELQALVRGAAARLRTTA